MVPGRHFKMILRPVASFSQSMSPFQATATHFMPKTKIFKILKTSQNPDELTYNLSKVSIDIKNATDAHTKLCVFAIHLPQRSLFENLDLAYLGSNWHQVLSSKP